METPAFEKQFKKRKEKNSLVWIATNGYGLLYSYIDFIKEHSTPLTQENIEYRLILYNFSFFMH